MPARKLEKFPVQLLSLNAITVDLAIQSRVKTILEYQREFSEALLMGATFPPVTVFFDGKRYWLADGFHRYGAYKQAARANRKFEGIPAEVRPGTRREAMVYSAGANIKFSIPRTSEDKRKAILMLLEDDEWFRKPNLVIGQHCGVSGTTVQKTRTSFCESRGIALPDYAETERGTRKINKQRDMSYPPRIREHTEKGKKAATYWTTIDGRTHYLGSDRNQAEAKLNTLTSDPSTAKWRIAFNNGALTGWLARRGVECTPVSVASSKNTELVGFTTDAILCTWDNFSKPDSAEAAIGRALLLREHTGSPHPPIVICYPDEGPAEILALGRRIGVEFLTPEELVARVKGEATQEPEGQQ